MLWPEIFWRNIKTSIVGSAYWPIWHWRVHIGSSREGEGIGGSNNIGGSVFLARSVRPAFLGRSIWLLNSSVGWRRGKSMAWHFWADLLVFADQCSRLLLSAVATCHLSKLKFVGVGVQVGTGDLLFLGSLCGVGEGERVFLALPGLAGFLSWSGEVLFCWTLVGEAYTW
jgi:hypothetical protein